MCPISMERIRPMNTSKICLLLISTLHSTTVTLFISEWDLRSKEKVNTELHSTWKTNQWLWSMWLTLEKQSVLFSLSLIWRTLMSTLPVICWLEAKWPKSSANIRMSLWSTMQWMMPLTQEQLERNSLRCSSSRDSTMKSSMGWGIYRNAGN